MTEIKLVRIYDHEQPAGYRILVDRLWPRGMSKAKANLDEWAKEVGPSSDLRKWFNHEDAKFASFKQKYLAQLQENPALPQFLELIKTQLTKQDVLFLYGAKNKEHNQAVVLKEYVLQSL
ncbi:DUF488 family protein [Lactobacillus sp. ESL0677]|uniref:DUF488 domain-containing protein n=1 Tax=Lactobacillus sp. ESL0677 TaxID=2983208 RepID=UPI0023F9BEEB|nr:DUF488 family protein [Lactobacillus sp. ESL0677]WEV37096.1 DUF488 family protein [Lactobacillus sp. ESL0677]